MRLPKSLRLVHWGEFARVREEGRSVAGRYLVMGVAENGGVEKPFRVGFVTSKRVGNAVVRNRVRRRLRSIVREVGEALRGGVDVVTVARYRAGAATFDQLKTEWCWLARKSGIWVAEDGREGA